MRNATCNFLPRFFRAEYLDDVALYRKLVIVKRVRDKTNLFLRKLSGTDVKVGDGRVVGL